MKVHANIHTHESARAHTHTQTHTTGDLGVAGRHDGEDLDVDLVGGRQRVDRLHVRLHRRVHRRRHRRVLLLLHRTRQPLPAVNLATHKHNLPRVARQRLHALLGVGHGQKRMPLPEVPGLEPSHQQWMHIPRLPPH